MRTGFDQGWPGHNFVNLEKKFLLPKVYVLFWPMTFAYLSKCLAYFAIACSFFPLSSGIFRFRERPGYLKLLCIIAGVSLLTDVSSMYNHSRNLSINISAIFEFLSFLILFFLIFEKRKLKIFILVGICGLAFGVTNFIFIQKDNYNTYTRIFAAIVFIALPVIFFYRTMRDLSNQKINHMPAFWIVSGVLLYFSGSLFLYSVYDFLAADAKPPYTKLLIYWDFHAVVEIGTQALFAISFWQKNSFIYPAPIDGQLYR